MGEKKKKNSGFTLIELIVAVALFAIVIGPLFQAFSSSIKANSRARVILKSTGLAQSVLDSIERSDVDTLKTMDYSKIVGKLLPKGTTVTSYVRSVPSGSGDLDFVFFEVIHEDLKVNVKVHIHNGGTTNTNKGNKYFMYTADVYVHPVTGTTSATAFTANPFVHLKGSVKNVE